MDTLLRQLLKREQLEEKRYWENTRIAHVQTHISRLKELESGTKASEAYHAEMDKFIREAEDARASLTALDAELEYMEEQNEAQEEDYDDSDKRKRIEQYEKMIREAKERMKRDAVVVKRSEREISRLARVFGS